MDLKFCLESAILKAAPRSYLQTLGLVQLCLTPLEMYSHGREQGMRQKAVQGGSAAAQLGQLSFWLLEQLARETCEAHSALALNPVLVVVVGPL